VSAVITFTKLGHYGRIGNQMFQYAALMGIATKYGYEFGYPPENEERRTAFGHKERCDLRRFFSNIRNDWPGASGFRSVISYYNEPEGDFSDGFKLLDDCPDECNLQGYFQSGRYFKHCEGKIWKAFHFHPEVVAKCSALASELCQRYEVISQNLVSVHVRRAEYLVLSHVLPPLTRDYYERAVEMWSANAMFVLFGDDAPWMADNLPKVIKKDRYVLVDRHSPEEDLCLMTMCHGGNIIANSSFSWWGAWLNPSPQKRIVAPHKWFGPAGPKNYEGIYCPGWLRT
jgi:hypothetical protein